jgi:hypothetical protein
VITAYRKLTSSFCPANVKIGCFSTTTNLAPAAGSGLLFYNGLLSVGQHHADSFHSGVVRVIGRSSGS